MTLCAVRLCSLLTVAQDAAPKTLQYLCADLMTERMRKWEVKHILGIKFLFNFLYNLKSVKGEKMGRLLSLGNIRGGSPVLKHSEVHQTDANFKIYKTEVSRLKGSTNNSFTNSWKTLFQLFNLTAVTLHNSMNAYLYGSVV